MGNRPIVDWRSLTVQMVVTISALVLITALSVGLPAIILIRDQVERQAWSQVGQGIQATVAIYSAAQSNIDDLATLTAQRPTLRQLLPQSDVASLSEYLQTLRVGTDLDLLIICGSDARPIAQAGQAVDAKVCELAEETGFYTLTSDDTKELWLLATGAVADGTSTLAKVVVGTALDDEFAQNLQNQTGLEHTLLLDGTPSASSISGSTAAWEQGTHLQIDTGNGRPENAAEFMLDGQPYYASRIVSIDPHFVDEVALNVAGVVATEERLVDLLAGSIAAIVIIGSALGIFMARRVGRPLTELADAAEVFSTGNLDSSLYVEAQVREVSQLAQALENARIELRKSVDELRQAKTWTENLLDSINEGIVTLDSDGNITFFSPGAERIIGVRQEEVMHKHCDEVFTVADTDERFSRHLPPPDRQVKTAVILQDGRVVTLSLTGARLMPPGTDATEIALVFRDVSEIELVHHFMGEFLANITHEFRTPLSALAASSELLLDQAEELTGEELRRLLNSLYMGIVGLQTLVDNLLETARLEAGRFRVFPHPVEMTEIVAEATHIMRPLLERHGQQLLVEFPSTIPVVRADARRVTQVLVNLLSNANKYSPDDTIIAVKVTVKGPWARVAVIDQGPGISADFYPSLFRRFARPETATVKSRYGAGLGLPIVKAIVEAHGGEVGVENGARAGVEFWFTLPMSQEE